jgi:hypothetical protein
MGESQGGAVVEMEEKLGWSSAHQGWVESGLECGQSEAPEGWHVSVTWCDRTGSNRPSAPHQLPVGGRSGRFEGRNVGSFSR